MDRLDHNLYRLLIPIPNNPLKSLNSYLLQGSDRNLLIDTGLDHPEAVAAMQAALSELAVDLTRTDFFLTHLHADHSAMLYTLMTPTSRAYASAEDAPQVNDMVDGDDRWQTMENFAVRNGFPAAEVTQAFRCHPGLQHGPKRKVDFTLLADGDCLTVGEYKLRVVFTPGHTGGHLCLYDPDRQYLFSGDHILGDITPNIPLWWENDDPLADYYRSLDKIAALAVRKTFPGHRSLLDSPTERISQLRCHHDARCQEILALLENEPATSYAVAARMTWDLRGTWETFPPAQKWFAAGEATAHLCYLENQGFLARQEDSGQTYFYRT